MIMQGRVIAIKPHFEPIWGCFGSLLGVCKAQHAFLFLSKLKHTLAYITGQIFFLFTHKKFKFEHVGMCFCHKILFSVLLQPVLGGLNGHICPPIPSNIYICISRRYTFTVYPCFHKKNQSMIIQKHIFAIKLHFSAFLGAILGPI